MSYEEHPDHGGERDELEGEPYLASISEEELKGRLKRLDEEGRALSYRRLVLQGRIDLIRTELVRRGGVAFSPENLTRVLMSGESNRSEGEGGV
jgi:hypothetical protein